MARPIVIARLANYARDAANGIIGATLNTATVDAELNQLTIGYGQMRSVLTGITTVSGQLTGVAASTAQSLVGAQRFVATSAQTVFVTTIVYDASFTNLNVDVFSSGVRLDPNSVTPADAAGFLQVTIPSQVLSTVVIVEAFAAGAGVLTKLATFDTAGSGTDLVGIYDPGGLIIATTLTSGLQEIVGNLNTLTAGVGNTADLIKRTGTVAWTANQSLGGFRLTNLADGTGTQDAVTVNQFNQYGATLNALQTYFLRLDGTTVMAAALPMGNNKITGLANGTVATDAATFGQLSSSFLPLAGGTFTGNLVSNGTATVTGLPSAVNPSDAVPLSQAQSLVAPFSSLSNYTVAGANTFVVPSGTTKISVEIWGAGGGGNTISGVPNGGGGGAYGTAVITVTPGETLTLGIGAGGAAGNPGTLGGTTSIARGATILLQSTGGAGAVAGYGTGVIGGVTTSPAGIAFWGINGQTGDVGIGGSNIVGGRGGDAPRGGPGGAQVSTTGAAQGGNAGVAPGGGGGGGIAGATGGAGAAGQITIRY